MTMEAEIGGKHGQHKEQQALPLITRSEKRQGLFPDDFDFRLLDSRTMGKYISVVFSHLVCGNLLQQF